MAAESPEPITNFNALPWHERVELVTTMMREVSQARDPMTMVTLYGSWVRRLRPADRFVALSRRDLTRPHYRITRSGLWDEQGRSVDPWRQRDRLPILDRGVLGDLLYAERAVILGDFHCPPDDPSCEHLAGFRSLMAMPAFEDGVAVNMTVVLKREPDAFDPEELANQLWNANLFGRATKNLVLNDELRKAYEVVNRELRVVADIQRSLLPAKLPDVPGVEFAAHYQTSTQSGGDYYDFFELDDGRLGILIADVSGHGSPAAVMMAVTHSIAHTRDDDPPTPPNELLSFINRRLARRYTNNGTFVTAFYGIYDPATRLLRYCNAGHNAPRVRRKCGTRVIPLDENASLPLGIVADEEYADATIALEPGDTLVLYTDGITEARNRADELFGVERLDGLALACGTTARAMVDTIVRAVNEFSDYAPATDDRTLVVGRIQ